MLFFVGKDVLRWIDQCCECVERIPEASGAGYQPQSFAGLLTANPPETVRGKLVRWGVADYLAIFSRAIGLNSIFQSPPAIEAMAEEFLRSYHHYADALFRCSMDSHPHPPALPGKFRFELYASGEYSRMLESEWGET